MDAPREQLMEWEFLAESGRREPLDANWIGIQHA